MKRVIAITFAILALAGPAKALDEGSILWVSWIQPRAGQEAEFEQALKAHHDWRREQGDTWSWLVWRIGSGERTGTYAVGTFGHRWSEFDSPPVDEAAARAHFINTVEPHVDSTRVEHYSYLASLGNLRADLPPRKFSVTEAIEVHVGMEREFLDAIAKITAAIKEQAWPVYYEWYQLETGGTKPAYARVRLLWSWGDLADQEMSLREVLVKTYGPAHAQQIADQFNRTVRQRENRTALLRPDLFYLPTPAP